MAVVSPHDHGEFLAAHYALIQGIVRRVARRRRLSTDDTEELRSAVHLRLLEKQTVLTGFEGRSNLTTYLLRVVDRIFLDGRIAEFGRFRPSAEARRIGATAVHLERLIFREHLPFDQACEMLRQNHGVAETRADLERMWGRLRTRAPRPMLCSLEQLPIPLAVLDEPPEAGVEQRRREALHQRIGAAIQQLPAAERRLLRLRFDRGWSVARIARTLNTDQKGLYRQFARIYAELREAAGDHHDRRTARGQSRRRMASARSMSPSVLIAEMPQRTYVRCVPEGSGADVDAITPPLSSRVTTSVAV